MREHTPSPPRASSSPSARRTPPSHRQTSSEPPPPSNPTPPIVMSATLARVWIVLPSATTKGLACHIEATVFSEPRCYAQTLGNDDVSSPSSTASTPASIPATSSTTPERARHRQQLRRAIQASVERPFTNQARVKHQRASAVLWNLKSVNIARSRSELIFSTKKVCLMLVKFID